MYNFQFVNSHYSFYLNIFPDIRFSALSLYTAPSYSRIDFNFVQITRSNYDLVEDYILHHFIPNTLVYNTKLRINHHCLAKNTLSVK